MGTERAATSSRKCRYILFLATFSVFWMLYLQAPSKPDIIAFTEKTKYVANLDIKHLLTNLTLLTNESESSLESQFAVYSSKCKIRNLNPFNHEILPYFELRKYVNCSDKQLLTYIIKKDNTATLFINKSRINQYSSNGVDCCYSYISRTAANEKSSDPDMKIDVSVCKPFKNNVTITKDVVMVKCTNGRSSLLYKNIHAVVKIDRTVQEKIEKFNDRVGQQEEHLSVFIFGIDSVSRSSFIRSMPKTYAYVKENAWIDFKGYNKIGDNTFPNVMGFFAGLNETTAFHRCDPKVVGKLDGCSIIWKDYKRLGFVTGYGEDSAFIHTFNYLKKGFRYPPTDYYFRPYVLATEEHLKNIDVDRLTYCTVPETAGERIFNLARDFTSTFKNVSSFGYFWTNSFSHNDNNVVSRMDDKVLEFLQDLNRTEIHKNSVVIFMSDHGFRFGTIVYTHTGWLEERLPFFYMSVPSWLKQKYPSKYQNLLINTERLTTPYDLYMTLQEILVLAGKNYSIKASDACPKCKSLFEAAEKERSCEDAAIEEHWCTCNSYLTIQPTSLIAIEIAKFIISEVHKTQIGTGAEFENCLEFHLKKIISAGVSNSTEKNTTYFLVTLETTPEAVFQGTVGVNMGQIPFLTLEGSISRLDVYADHSWCVSDATLRKYCYCGNKVKYFVNSFSSFIRSVGDAFNVFSRR